MVLNPTVLISLEGRRSQLRVFSEHLLQEINTIWRNVFEVNPCKRRFLLQNILHYLSLSIPVERRLVAQHHIQNNSCGPDVAFLVIALAEHFRSNVIRCANAS